MGVYDITPTLKLLDVTPPIPGYGYFIGAYLFQGKQTALIDTGPRSSLPNLFKALTRLGISPLAIDYIILSHIHLDHTGGVGTAIKEMSNARVVAHSRAKSHLIDPTALWQASLKTLGDIAIQYGEPEPVPEHRIIIAKDQMKLELGGELTLELYLTPGHAAHHLSVFHRASGIAIAGEAAGVCVNGQVRPTTPPPFKMGETLASIDKLIQLQPQKLCYLHFGCFDNAVERLKRYREKLLLWHKLVNNAARSGKTPEDIFTLLRKEDPELNYLDTMSQDEYAREAGLLINGIVGLTEVPHQS